MARMLLKVGQVYLKMIKDDKPLRKNIPIEESDGHRVAIVVGIGLAKMHHMQYHDWKPELAPTQVLKDDLLNHRITWPQYQNGYDKVGYGKVKGYDDLIAERPEAQQLLRKWKREYANFPTKHLTLLCYCLDKNICHRSIVKRLILEAD